RLHRNFMGYTTTHTDLLIGLGASAISDARYGYAQNLKKVEAYAQAVSEDELPVFKGHIQTDEDLSIKRVILDIACHGEISNESIFEFATPEIAEQLRVMQNEGILKRNSRGLRVTDSGRAFVRNICSVFDKHIHAAQQNNSVQV